MIRDSIVI